MLIILVSDGTTLRATSKEAEQIILDNSVRTISTILSYLRSFDFGTRTRTAAQAGDGLKVTEQGGTKKIAKSAIWILILALHTIHVDESKRGDRFGIV